MEKRKGILLTSDFDVAIRPVRDKNGMITSGFVISESTNQEAIMVLKLRQGELKEDPLLGCGLTKFMRGKYDESMIENRIRLHFTRTGIDYEGFKNKMDIQVR
jgi:hypothetical protein